MRLKKMLPLLLSALLLFTSCASRSEAITSIEDLPPVEEMVKLSIKEIYQIKADLDYSQQQRDIKERELQGLLQSLRTFEQTVVHDGALGSGGSSREPQPQTCAEMWVDQARGLAKSCPGNDEDSDTGLSSMHSQDSDSVPPVCEALV